MKPIYTQLGGALSLTIAIAACVPAPRSTPPVQTRPTPAPMPVPAPLPTPTFSSWMDAPQTLGDWSYSASAGGGSAQFGPPAGEPLFAMRCDAGSRNLVLTRFGVASQSNQMIVRSESQSRTIPAASQNGVAVSRLAASDRLLDAMALSKGRFTVEIPGASPLYLPSWAEVTRVIEDCR